MHHIPFWGQRGDDVLPTLHKYLQPEQEPLLQRLANASNEFAVKYTGGQGRMLYWHKVREQGAWSRARARARLCMAWYR